MDEKEFEVENETTGEGECEVIEQGKIIEVSNARHKANTDKLEEFLNTPRVSRKG